MIGELSVLVDGCKMGTLLRDPVRNRLRFSYDPQWLAEETAFPLSLSMPLDAAEHGHEVIEAFLFGLLPDDDSVLRKWGRRHQVSAANPFHLLRYVGEDCAGAVQFVSPDREYLTADTAAAGSIEWIEGGQLAERMSLLRRDSSASRLADDSGRFTIAGAQPKTALFYDEERRKWAVPAFGTPTTHILKPTAGEFDGLAENEHFCLELAKELELPAVHSWVESFPDGPVIIVQRYDRTRLPGPQARIARIHQEDFCQALGCRPQSKYQNQGGPGASAIIDLLRRHSCTPEQDIRIFAEALVLNWLLCGTDAHAKNFSLMISPGAKVNLAPLYDISSALPYPKSVDLRRAGLAMKIGGRYRLREIGISQWQGFSEKNSLPWDWLRSRILELAQTIPAAAERVARRMGEVGLDHAVVIDLPRLLAQRSTAILGAL